MGLLSRLLMLLAVCCGTATLANAQQVAPPAKDAKAASTRPPLPADLQERKRLVQADMRDVASRLKPEHFAQCKAKLEQPSLLARQVRVVGDYRQNLVLSCMVQGRNGLFTTDGSRKAVAYSVSVAILDGEGNAGKLRRKRGLCWMSLDSSGQVLVGAGSQYPAQRVDLCRRLY